MYYYNKACGYIYVGHKRYQIKMVVHAVFETSAVLEWLPNNTVHSNKSNTRLCAFNIYPVDIL